MHSHIHLPLLKNEKKPVERATRAKPPEFVLAVNLLLYPLDGSLS